MTKYLWILAALPLALGCPGDKGDTGSETDTDTDTDTDSDTDPSFDVSHSSSGVSLTITNGSGDYEFGMAETDSASSDPWTGEDCVFGYDTGTGTNLQYCHPASSSGVTLTGGTLAELEADVEGTTIMQNVSSSVTTYYVISDSTGDCWVWGHDTSYYAGELCTEM